MNKPLFAYKWYLKDRYPALNIEKHNLKVYSTFSCGGGSSMGYKLAGYDVIGANDIDPQMAKVYKENQKPRFYDICPIGDLLTKNLPAEYYNLDILDGSPPCSTFSMAGSREKAFKKDKVFRQAQAKQVLSDLFFDWIKLVDKLKPKVAIAENVKGMLVGNAKAYTKQILNKLSLIGYDIQLFCLNGATMGLPQTRERVFFICRRKDLNLPKINLEFNCKPIGLEEAFSTIKEFTEERLTDQQLYYWNLCKEGESFSKYHPKGSLFGQGKVHSQKPCGTLTTKMDSKFHYKYKRYLTNEEWQLIGSYPLDYKFLDISPKYLIGMSVPPVVMAQVSYQVYLQLFKKIDK
jgi:DNA (cytosine-5)-methyltransferase 1